MNIQNICKIIRAGGATLNGDGEAVHFSRGYQVSFRDCYTLNAANVSRVLRAVNRLLKRAEPGAFVGLWVDAGRVYIDISERVDRLSDAIRAGVERGQKSIYDWTMRRCISLEA